jgi:ElaB/YqjD/DUF883 family membrane-anchored ribosome-binding protein
MTANFETATVESAARPASMRSLSDQSGRVVQEVQELGRVAAAGVSDAAAKLRQKGRHAIDTGVDGARKAKEELGDIIGKHPVKSVLIALGVGAVVGFLLRRRS